MIPLEAAANYPRVGPVGSVFSRCRLSFGDKVRRRMEPFVFDAITVCKLKMLMLASVLLTARFA